MTFVQCQCAYNASEIFQAVDVSVKTVSFLLVVSLNLF